MKGNNLISKLVLVNMTLKKLALLTTQKAVSHNWVESRRWRHVRHVKNTSDNRLSKHMIMA